MPPKQWHSASPAPRARHTSPSYPPPSRKPVFGWLLHKKSIINWRPSKATMYFYFFIFCRSIRRPKQWDNVPHTFCPGRVSSPTPLSPSTTTFGWLLCPPIKRRPSKAKGPPIYLIFCRLIRPPKRRATVLPTRSDPASPLLQRTL
jgi:hypothetical protein